MEITMNTSRWIDRLSQKAARFGRRLFQREERPLPVGLIWGLPLGLFLFASSVELAEEFILEQFWWYERLHFIFETLIFGILGPFMVFWALLYIYALLQDEHQLRRELETLNAQLEEQVHERTAALEASNFELQKANHALRQLDEIKSDFVSLVSHELRAPLTTLHGGLELALQKSETLPPDTRSILKTMYEESRRLIRLVQSILDVSRLEAGRLSLHLGPLALRPMLARSVNVLYGQRRPVQWKCDQRVPPVWADETYLEEIIRNLLRNADKYSPPDQPVEICLQQDGEHVRLEIADYGPGIPPVEQAAVFERFYRLNRREDAPPGWGLGLYFARKFADAQGIKLSLRSPWRDSAECPGTAFILHIPIASCENEEDDGTFTAD